MKALVYNGKVEEVRETPFEIHPDMEWVDCPEWVKPDDLYSNGEFTSPQPIQLDYKDARSAEYPPIGDQLDALWKGGEEAEAMKFKIQEIKSKFLKTS